MIIYNEKKYWVAKLSDQIQGNFMLGVIMLLHLIL